MSSIIKSAFTRCLATACLGAAVALAARTSAVRDGVDSTTSGRSRTKNPPCRATAAAVQARLPAKARGRINDESLATRLHRDGVVTVGGQVQQPGRMAMTAGMTLGSVIERAGGTTPFGSMKRVKLRRGAEIREFDLTRGNNAEEPLLPDDCLMVSQKTFFGN